MLVDAQIVLDAAEAEGFELSGLTPAVPHADFERYQDWVSRGNAAGMEYLVDHRAGVRQDPRQILPEVETLLCVGKLYKTPGPKDWTAAAPGEGWISRYAWGERDYHDVIGEGLHRVAARVEAQIGKFRYRVAVDSAPLLERSYARQAGLGWIGKNTCLIHEGKGSWYFLGELMLPFAVSGYGQPAADRCGSCTRCIEACPTLAIVEGSHGWEVDSSRCISYWTIEAREEAPEDLKRAFGKHLFGCDICQDVCPWNRRAPETTEPGFQWRGELPVLETLEADAFRERYRRTPVSRTKLEGWNRNVRVALENDGEDGLEL